MGPLQDPGQPGQFRRFPMAPVPGQQENLVGEGAQVTHAEKVLFADTVAKYLNARYELGARGPHAYDCVSFVWHFYRDIGRTLPESCGGVTAADYAALYRADKAAAHAVH